VVDEETSRRPNVLYAARFANKAAGATTIRRIAGREQRVTRHSGTRTSPPDAMPVLPQIFRRARAASSDTRILDSRQLRAASHALLRRIPQRLLKRNDNSAECQAGYIPGCYQFGGASPGAVAGITLGAIAGFLLVLWLLWVLSNGTTFIQTSTLQERDEVMVRRRSRSPRSRRSHSHRSTYQAEMRHSSPRRERVIRQERIVRDIPRGDDRSRVRETVIVEEQRPERRVDGDDIVEVIEEHSSIGGGAPPPRRKSRRSSGYR
jgi:hypothetical protein